MEHVFGKIKQHHFAGKFLFSVRIIPVIFLTLAALVFSLTYGNPRFTMAGDSHRPSNLTIGGWYFGIFATLLLIDIGMEYEYRSSSSIAYSIASFCHSLLEGALTVFCIGHYFRYVPEGENKANRLLAVIILILLALVNILYRFMSWQKKWTTEVSKGNDLIAAYIGFLGFGNCALASLPLTALWIAEPGRFDYVVIFVWIAFFASLLETLLGAIWLSMGAVRNYVKSNFFFYLTIFNFFAALAAVIVTSFGYAYHILTLPLSYWCWASFGIALAVWASSMAYLAYLGVH